LPVSIAVLLVWFSVGQLADGPNGGSPASAESMQVSKFGERFDAFLLFWQDRQANLGTLEELQSRPPGTSSDWTILILGGMPTIEQFGIEVESFLREGGSLLVASDRSMNLPLGPALRILHGPIRSSRDSSSYQGNSACPLVSEFRRDHPLMAGIEEIALNLPGVFAGGDSVVWGIAYLPRTLDVRVFSRVWLVGGELDLGRFVASSDQSPFTNEMIEEADNARFADNVVSWLTSKRGGKGGRVVCLINGRPITKLVDERFISGQWESRPPTSEILNELLRGLEEEDVLNAVAREAQASLHQASPWLVRQAGTVLAGSIVGALLAWRILGARDARTPFQEPLHSQEGWVPALHRSLTSGLPRTDRLLETRQKAMTAAGHYREQIRIQARAFLQRWFGPGGLDNASSMELDQAISFPDAGWWTRRRIRLRLAGLRRLASNQGQEQVNERKFRFWESEIRWLDSIKREVSPRPGSTSENHPS
jgi:hypothetical protein